MSRYKRRALILKILFTLLAAVMALDKKAEGDGVRCVLLTKIGACTGTVIRGAQLEALV